MCTQNLELKNINFEHKYFSFNNYPSQLSKITNPVLKIKKKKELKSEIKVKV